MIKNQLILGDCLDELRKIPSDSIDCILTDPPYGISYRSGHTGSRKIANDDLLFVWWLFDAYRVLKPGGTLVCFTDPKTQHQWRSAILWAGFDVRSQLVWYKNHFGAGDLKGGFAPQHEVAWYAVKGKHQWWWLGLEGWKRLSSVLPYRKPLYNDKTDARFHPTQKPVDMFEDLVKHCCPPGGIVLDPFAGSATTLLAAKKQERDWIGIEMDSEYWEKGTARLR